MIVSVMALLFVVGLLTSVALAQATGGNEPVPAANEPAPAPAAEKAPVAEKAPAAEKAKGPDKIKIGDVAPAFDLMDQDGKNVSLVNFAAKKVLVYFYPKANSPTCTKQACAIRDSMEELTKLGINVIGISPDATDVLKKFAEKNKLTFPLLSDPDHKVADSYGVWTEKIVKGKATAGINRSSFLIGEDGKIAKTWYRVSSEKTAKLAIAFLSKANEPKEPKANKAPKEAKEPKAGKEPGTEKKDK